MKAKSKDDWFCFFSGYAHQDVELIQYDKDVELKIVVLTCINRGNHILSLGNYIQLDGILFELIECNDSYFKACSTFELIQNTTIEGVSSGNRLTLGVLAENDLAHERLWMLQPSAFGQATYKNYSVLEEHQHTLKLDFEAPIEFSTVIQSERHLGLAGSSLTAKQISYESNLIKFSIYCGRETRENSQFNQNLMLGTSVNMNGPAAVVDKTCSQGYK